MCLAAAHQPTGRGLSAPPPCLLALQAARRRRWRSSCSPVAGAASKSCFLGRRRLPSLRWGSGECRVHTWVQLGVGNAVRAWQVGGLVQAWLPSTHTWSCCRSLRLLYTRLWWLAVLQHGLPCLPPSLCRWARLRRRVRCSPRPMCSSTLPGGHKCVHVRSMQLRAWLGTAPCSLLHLAGAMPAERWAFIPTRGYRSAF